MRVVDAHAHVIPPGVVQRIRSGTAPDGIRLEQRDGLPHVIHRQGYSYPLLPEFHDVAARIGLMEDQGIDEAVLSVAPPFFLYWADVESAIASSRLVNDSLSEMARMAPDRFSALATLPLQSPAAAARELHRAVDELNMVGAQVGPHCEGRPLDHESMRPVLSAAQALRVPLVIHPYYVGHTRGLEDFYLTNLQGNPFQTAVCASRLMFSGVLDQFQDLEIVLLHGGGHLPYQIGRLQHGYKVRPEAQRCAMSPLQYIQRFHFDTLTHHPAATAWLVDLVGADRVLYGTDAPFDMGGGPLSEQLNAAALSADELEAVAHGNSDRLFGAGRRERV